MTPARATSALFALCLAAAPALAQDGQHSGWTGFLTGDRLGGASRFGQVSAHSTVPAIGVQGHNALSGLQAGYQYDFGQLVLGGEINRQLDPASVARSSAAVEETRRLKARIGFDAGAWLPYAVIGYSWQDTSDPTSSFNDEGASYGIGAAYQINNWIVLGTELMDHDLNSRSGTGLTDQLKTTLRFSYDF